MITLVSARSSINKSLCSLLMNKIHLLMSIMTKQIAKIRLKKWITGVSDLFVYYHFAGGSPCSFGPVQAGHFLWHGSQLLSVFCKPFGRKFEYSKKKKERKTNRLLPMNTWIWFYGSQMGWIYLHTQTGARTLPVEATEASSCACKGLDGAPGSVCTSSWQSSGSGRESAAPCTRCRRGPAGQCWNHAQVCEQTVTVWPCQSYDVADLFLRHQGLIQTSLKHPLPEKPLNNTLACLHWKYAVKAAYLGLSHQSLYGSKLT